MAAACGGASRWGALVRGRLLRRSRNSAGYSTALTAAGGRGKGALVQRGRSSQNDKYRRETANPRTEKMEVDQDWTSVYPVAAAFKPSCVPLPLRMGYPVKRGVPPVKEGNLELLKIPNFLHLTPVAIRKHCAALKDFCTEWPADVDNDEKCMQHFPIEVDTVDYISAGPSVRNPKARVVTLTVKLSSLNLDDHAKKKLIKLVGERYCEGTDTLTITTDRKQKSGKKKRRRLTWRNTSGRTAPLRRMLWRHWFEYEQVTKLKKSVGRSFLPHKKFWPTESQWLN
ncbi:28S ribosomal protein S35, mitochondrial isoform X2 [Lacerta agilis]|uniref:28S ribosomal protein S35, mitochondrial isoform X2 n=1 Tax=Lacerta agilis TaxID=80427 RepID=UPI0014199ED7|nr:28S ribosomal protein S35, mitochondrial isoform X2 [Lacerta agilis]